ncbi:MAG: transporter substrate-binding domain-containing protein [Roseococcus sp.]|nr:transporter substrate-binding domain-containing protein [Roseococcus sp.]
MLAPRHPITRRVALFSLVPALSPALVQAQSWAVAPGPVLRVAIITSNPVLVTPHPHGPPGGVAVGLAEALGTMLGKPLQLIPYATPAAFEASLGSGAWDVGFAVRDPAGAARLALSDVFMVVDQVYLARPGSSLAAAGDVDRPGVRVGVAQGSAADAFLTTTLRQAAIIRLPGGTGPARDALAQGRVDVFGDDAPLASQVAALLPGARMLEGRFTLVEMALALPPGQAEGLPVLNDFLRVSKQRGRVERLIAASGLQGVRQTP